MRRTAIFIGVLGGFIALSADSGRAADHWTYTNMKDDKGRMTHLATAPGKHKGLLSFQCRTGIFRGGVINRSGVPSGTTKPFLEGEMQLDGDRVRKLPLISTRPERFAYSRPIAREISLKLLEHKRLWVRIGKMEDEFDLTNATNALRPVMEACDIRPKRKLTPEEARRGMKAVAAYKAKNYAEAYRLFLINAKAGDATAQYFLGQMHKYGRSVEKDPKQAAAWYRKSAEGGDMYAQFELCGMLLEGRGVHRNRSRARYWCLKSASQNYWRAHYTMARIYERGLGGPRSDRQAVYWYRLPARRGYAPAQHHLALKYEKGLGVAQSYSQAVKWYKRAAEQGHAPAQTNYGRLQTLGKGSTRDDIQALKWFYLGAKAGDQSAQTNAETLEKSLSPEQIRTAKGLAEAWVPKKEGVRDRVTDEKR